MSDDEACLCGKKKININPTNWKRHLSACKTIKKKNSSSKYLNTYFKRFLKTSNSTESDAKKMKKNDEQHIITVCKDIHVGDMGNEDNDKALDIIIPDLNSVITVKDINGDQDMTDEQHEQHITVCKDIHVDDMGNGDNDKALDIIISDLNTSIALDNVNGDHENISACNDYIEDNTLTLVEDLDKISNQYETFPHDPALLLCSNISIERFSQIAHQEPCQPQPTELKNSIFPLRKQGKHSRSFHEQHYFKKIATGEFVKRKWLSYSPTEDKVYCIVCKQFGTTDGKSNQLARCGSNDWRHISFKLDNHEASPNHLQSEVRKVMYLSNQRVDLKSLQNSNTKVAENREIVKVILEVLLYLARQNSSFRGHDESWLSKNQGNFLELIKLFAKHNALLSSHIATLESAQKKNRLTFLSNNSQNTMLLVMSDIVRSQILKKVKKAGIFSIMIDTTTDVSNIEQFSLILRFVDEFGEVKERLVALESTNDATGRGMFDLLCNICDKYDLDWINNLCAQTYDGAASMQGQYSGLRSYVQEKNPRALYVWCFSHVLNLVVVDTCDRCTSIRNFFGDMQVLISFMRARKRTAIFLEEQKKCYPNDRVLRIKNFSSTRWTSHDKAIAVIENKYDAVMNTLEILSKSMDRDCSSTAKNLLEILSSFKFVTNLLLMKKIFAFTTPLSKYLQSPSIDFIQALCIVDSTTKKIINIRTVQCADDLLMEAKQFATSKGLTEIDFPQERVRRKKRMPGENTSDQCVTKPDDKFRTEVYFVIVDQILSSINSRFEGSRTILYDLSLLSFDRILDVNKGLIVPNNSFSSLVKWIPNLKLNELKNEYFSFSSCIMKLQKGMTLEQSNTIRFESTQSCNDSENSTPSEDSENEDSRTDKTKLNSLQILKLLNSYNLVSAFPNLYTAYKYLCTIPSTSVSNERSFSKLKLIKTRLRSTMHQTRLESLILLSCEKDIPIDLEEALDKYASTSTLLQKSLLFK